MARTVRRLTDLEIDEVSLVDRSANQHATVAIAKRDGEPGMGIFDADGYEVDESELEHGQYVYDDEGNEFIHVDPDALDEDDLEVLAEAGVSDEDLDDLYEDYAESVGEDNLVGKGDNWGGVVPGTHGAFTGKKGKKLRSAGNEYGRALAGGAAGNVAANVGVRRMMSGAKHGGKLAAAGFSASAAGTFAGGRRGARINREKGYTKGSEAMAKSLGESVYEELSKALGNGDRDEIFAKAMDLVEDARYEAAEAIDISKALADERDLQAWYAHCEGYGPLPMATEEVALIMKSASETLPASQVRKMDAMFSSMGEQLYAELGTAGGDSHGTTYETIESMALSHVGKSGLSGEQAIVSIFEANPDAYDAYLAEGRS